MLYVRPKAARNILRVLHHVSMRSRHESMRCASCIHAFAFFAPRIHVSIHSHVSTHCESYSSEFCTSCLCHVYVLVKTYVSGFICIHFFMIKSV